MFELNYLLLNLVTVYIYYNKPSSGFFLTHGNVQTQSAKVKVPIHFVTKMAFKRHFSILLSLLYFCFAMEASWLCAIPVIDCQGELPKVLEVRSPRPTWNMWDKQNLTTFRTTTPSVVTCVGLAVLNKFFAVLYFKGKHLFNWRRAKYHMMSSYSYYHTH